MCRLISILFTLITFSVANDSSATAWLKIVPMQKHDLYLNDSLLTLDSTHGFIPLKPGNYTIRSVMKNAISWRFPVWQQTIDLHSGDSLLVEIPDSNWFQIVSEPILAQVFYGESYLGNTPLYLDKSVYASRILKVKKEGFIEEIIDLHKDTAEIAVRLKKDPEKFESGVLRAGLDNSGINYYRESMLITSLVSSWAAFYFKREANRNYERYLSTGDARLMNKYFSQTENFDTYAEIAFTVSVVTLGTYIYLLVTD